MQSLAPERTCYVAGLYATARQRIAREVLAGMDVTAHPASYVLWLRLQAHQRPDHVAAVLAEEGILVSTADGFAVGPHRPHALRLALGTSPRHELEPALRRLRAAIEAIPP